MCLCSGQARQFRGIELCSTLSRRFHSTRLRTKLLPNTKLNLLTPHRFMRTIFVYLATHIRWNHTHTSGPRTKLSNLIARPLLGAGCLNPMLLSLQRTHLKLSLAKDSNFVSYQVSTSSDTFSVRHTTSTGTLVNSAMWLTPASSPKRRSGIIIYSRNEWINQSNQDTSPSSLISIWIII